MLDTVHLLLSSIYKNFIFDNHTDYTKHRHLQTASRIFSLLIKQVKWALHICTSVINPHAQHEWGVRWSMLMSLYIYVCIDMCVCTKIFE